MKIIKQAIIWGTITLLFPAITFSKITKGPYLTEPKQTSMTIMWESDLSEKASLKYGVFNNLEHSFSVEPVDQKENMFLYVVKIENLNPGRKYYYQVLMSDSTDDVSYFSTMPVKNTPITFVALGDSRSDHEIHKKISELAAEISPDFVISMGDLVYRGGNFEEWEPHYFQPASDLIDHIPLISTLGDHDAGIDHGENFNHYFRFTEDHEKIWFSFDYGPAHFVSLDYRSIKDSTMIDWFEKDMAQSKAKWKFVYSHRPCYNVGGHRRNWGGEIWPELYRKHKVDIVFAGHSHHYERFFPMKPTNEPNAWPVTYITTGGAGAGLYESVQHENVAFTKSVNHLISIRLSSDSLKLTAYLPDMSILDQVEIVKNNNGQYNAEYLDLIKPQELMDAYMTFVEHLTMTFDQKPTEHAPAVKSISFTSRNVHEDMPFNVMLVEQSARYYHIDPISGILKKGEEFKGEIKLYSKMPYKIEEKRFCPPVRFEVSFKMKNRSGIAIGRPCRYKPINNN